MRKYLLIILIALCGASSVNEIITVRVQRTSTARITPRFARRENVSN